MDVWLEAALNGPWGRDRQPGIPVTADEIVADALAAAGAGAAVIHLHAYDERSGRQRDAYEIYAPIIERIRSSVDVVCCPTIPFAGSGDSTEPLSPAERFAAVERLLEAGLIEWSVVDPGSVNISLADDVAQGREGFVYANAESHVRHGLALAQAHRMTPSYAIYEPGFLRLGAALHRAVPGAPQPVYRFMFTDQFTFGFPPQEWALQAYLRLLRDEAPGAPWMVAGLGVDVEPLIGAAVRAGGHVRAGLEDAPLGCPDGNRELVERAARLITDAGGTLATAAQVRAGTAGLP
ncbi:3-keto-5-aminohexanoate cleavage protein [Pseudonocardia petroleophila]|uniref:3-keto-5-aminohexanoate cleavage protein n=1 Tax=Pseudonocardia petroleophila TaxID=37331 RepID=A0A7G7MLM1_9PSEU|nr:3-keto-5-aminohexanoate cleavage protein [Pseudonocardia petroleophila]QNG53682.1 3-keto-5-aminohexanoate cleavage protein [Pseudonocardia petroleophila]